METHRREVRDFLVSRRGRLRPEDVGLPSGGDRRVPGLRRGEVAMLAGVSTEYYSRLERGGITGASDGVLDALSDALRLDAAERQYLRQLAERNPRQEPRSQRASSRDTWNPGPSVQWMLDSMETSVAMIGNGRLELLAWNRLGGALVDQMITTTVPGRRPNFARFAFLEPAAWNFYPDWELNADMTVAMLRTEAGRHPHSRELHELVGELSTRSDQFRMRWSKHDVRQHSAGTKHYHHHIAGPLTLAYDSWEVVGHPGTRMTTYTAEPGSPSHDGLKILSSWAAENASSSALAPPHSA